MTSFPTLAVQGNGGITGHVFMWIIAIAALTLFAFIMRSRMELLLTRPGGSPFFKPETAFSGT